jgi:hypothetical protein
MSKPSTDISGHWDFNIEFFSGKTQHVIFLEQDGNWIRGTHQTDFETREMFGMIDGDKVTLRSDTPRSVPADSIPFIFSGAVSASGISGSVHMGEYLNAKFSAAKHGYPVSQRPIRVPNGPPLAT